MALVIEDGTGVIGADSYITLADARTLAAKYSWTLPVDDTAAEQALRNGYLWLNTFESQYSGQRSYEDQTGSFPREGAYCGQFLIPSNGIKQDVISAQVRAAMTYGQGVDVMPDSDGKNIASEEVTGAVKQSFFNNGKSNSDIEIREAKAFLYHCYLTQPSFNFSTVRG